MNHTLCSHTESQTPQDGVLRQISIMHQSLSHPSQPSPLRKSENLFVLTDVTKRLIVLWNGFDGHRNLDASGSQNVRTDDIHSDWQLHSSCIHYDDYGSNNCSHVLLWLLWSCDRKFWLFVFRESLSAVMLQGLNLLTYNCLLQFVFVMSFMIAAEITGVVLAASRGFGPEVLWTHIYQ